MIVVSLLYAALCGYGLLLVLQLTRSRGQDVLEVAGHIALALFLGILCHALDNENFRKQIDTSTAILALSACLVCFLFGIAVGKSWAARPPVTRPSGRPKDQRPLEENRSTSSATAAKAVPPAPTVSERAEGRPRFRSEDSVEADGTAPSTPYFGRGDPFSPRPTSAARLLSAQSKTEVLDSYDGFSITRSYVDEAADALATIVGISSKVEKYSSKQWSLLAMSTNRTYLWTTVEKREGVLLKGSAVATSPASAVVRWLLDRQLGTGLEGIMYRSETLLNNERENLCVQRFVCKSERVLLSSRCFLVVTAWRQRADGSYIVVTRSLPSEISKGSDKKNVRGTIYTSGYLVRTLVDSPEDRSTEILFGTHISFSRSGKSNIDKTKLDEISKCVSNSLSQAVLGAAEPYAEVAGAAPKQPGDSKDALELSTEQRSEMLLVANVVLSKLEWTHRSVDNFRETIHFGSLRSSREDLMPSELGSVSWNDIYNHDGILVSERLEESKTIGTLRATCTINAPPAVVHDLLTKHPEVVDSLVEERSVLARLNSKTSLQWIAYGSVWPVGAFDFLVVTLDDTCTSSNGKVGFVIVSTSIDGIVDEEEAMLEKDGGDCSGSEGGGDDDTCRSDRSKYSRSSLKMAGYVGVPNATGGTELTLYLDLDLYAYIPAWLMQLLAQNGLSEMMGRLREASVLMHRGQDPLPVASTSKFGSMLSQIQVREEKLRHLKSSDDGTGDSAVETIERKRPRSGDVGKEKNTAVAEQSSKGSSVKVDLTDVEVLKKMDFSSLALKRLLKYTGQTTQADFPLDWVLKLNKNDITISATPIVNSTWNALKAELVVNADIDVLRKLLVDDSRVGEYDDMFNSCELICRLNERSAIRRMTFKAVWPTQPRDFVLCTSWTELENNGIAITTMSVPDEVYPPQNGFVRGSVNISGYIITPIEPGQNGTGLKVTLCLHTDLGGSLPVGIINMLATSAPIKMLTTINQIARQESVRRDGGGSKNQPRNSK